MALLPYVDQKFSYEWKGGATSAAALLSTTIAFLTDRIPQRLRLRGTHATTEGYICKSSEDPFTYLWNSTVHLA